MTLHNKTRLKGDGLRQRMVSLGLLTCKNARSQARVLCDNFGPAVPCTVGFDPACAGGISPNVSALLLKLSRYRSRTSDPVS